MPSCIHRALRFGVCLGVCQRDGNLSGLTTVGDITRLEGTAYGLYPFADGIRIDHGNLLALGEGLHTLLCQGTRSSTPIHTDGGGQGDRLRCRLAQRCAVVIGGTTGGNGAHKDEGSHA